ncbi:MAG TPA: pyrroline-5-carboxylate reductase [Ramlibacter sp.]
MNLSDIGPVVLVGAGKMGLALARGWIAGGLPADRLVLCDPQPSEFATQFAAEHGIRLQASPIGVLTHVLVLAVKPQVIYEVMAEIQPIVGSYTLVLSIAAGIRGTDLSRWLGGYGAIVRTMPNTPALIGQGITGMVAMAGVSDAQKQAADSILRAVGKTVWLDSEDAIDPVTAVSGSGPAYVFFFLEAMQQAAVEMGLSSEQGRELAIATFTGAAQLAAQSDEPAEVLRQRVTSKGGTTHAAIVSMEAAGVKQAIVTAMKAAAARGRALGEELGRDS